MRHFILCLFLFVVTACQQRAIKPTDEHDEVGNDWYIVAKMFINNGTDSGSGRLTWREEQGQVNATFKAPLGQGSWSLDESTVSLIDDQGKTWRANSMDALIHDHLGIDLSWEKIKTWIKGDWPEQTQFDDEHNRGHFQWQGWQIELKKIKQRHGKSLAHRIHVSKGQQAVKLSIKSWQ